MTTSIEHPQTSDPHHLRLAREGILSLWGELVPEQQATTLITLMHEVMQSEYRAWVLETLQRTYLIEEGN